MGYGGSTPLCNFPSPSLHVTVGQNSGTTAKTNPSPTFPWGCGTPPTISEQLSLKPHCTPGVPDHHIPQEQGSAGKLLECLLQAAKWYLVLLRGLRWQKEASAPKPEQQR